MCASSLSANRPGPSTGGCTVLAEIHRSIVAVARNNTTVWIKMMVAMAVGGRVRAMVVYLWALRAVSYGVVSNNATGMPIAMKPHCGCALLMAVTEYERLSHHQ
jgi:hypothetical protein